MDWPGGISFGVLVALLTSLDVLFVAATARTCGLALVRRARTGTCVFVALLTGLNMLLEASTAGILSRHSVILQKKKGSASPKLT
jgi:hypothetical protein